MIAYVREKHCFLTDITRFKPIDNFLFFIVIFCYFFLHCLPNPLKETEFCAMLN